MCVSLCVHVCLWMSVSQCSNNYRVHPDGTAMGGPLSGATSQVPRTPSADHLRLREREAWGSGEGRREAGRERERDILQNKTQKPEATSQSENHSDPTQVARTRRSQIVLCDTRAIQQEQDAVCGMSQTPRRCIVMCGFLCICVHVWPSVDFCKKIEELGPLVCQRLTVNDRLTDKLN